MTNEKRFNIHDPEVQRFGRSFCEALNRVEFSEKARIFSPNERAVEYSFVFQSLTRIFPRSVLDVGTGQTALPSLIQSAGFAVAAIDNIHDYWREGLFNRHFHVINDDIRAPKNNYQAEAITCISVLEHIPEFNQAVDSMYEMLPLGGHLILSFPFCEQSYVPNAYELPLAGYGKNLPFICQIFSRSEIEHWCREGRMTVQNEEFWQIFSGEFWTEGTRVLPPRRASSGERHHLLCLVLRKEG